MTSILSKTRVHRIAQSKIVFDVRSIIKVESFIFLYQIFVEIMKLEFEMLSIFVFLQHSYPPPSTQWHNTVDQESLNNISFFRTFLYDDYVKYLKIKKEIYRSFLILVDII